jgi:hypothetical protein
MKDVEIIKLLSEFSVNLHEAVAKNGTATRGFIESEVNRIDEKLEKIIVHNTRQNGFLENHEECIGELKKEAEKCRDYRKSLGFAAKNWKFLAVAFVVLVFLLNVVSDRINWNLTIKKQAEKYGLELKDSIN